MAATLPRKQEAEEDKHDNGPLHLVPASVPVPVPSSTLKDSFPRSCVQNRALALAIGSLVALFLIMKSDEGFLSIFMMKSDEGSSSGLRVETKKPAERSKNKQDSASASASASPSRSCPNVCGQHASLKKKQWGGDLLDPHFLVKAVSDKRDELIERLKVQYGPTYYAQIFEADGFSRGRLAVLPAIEKDGSSIRRFQRKLKLKILQVQKAIALEQKDVSGCDCSTSTSRQATPANSDNATRRRISKRSNDTTPKEYHARMIWATGGHSAAAAHGNLHNESYTAFMERAVQHVFASVGVQFQGRNYAMGGTSGAPEIALCSQAVFGNDADVISWDFGMTDGGAYWAKSLYANRAGINPNRPAVVDIHIEGGQFQPRVKQLQNVQEQGLAALYVDPGQIDEMRKAIPDMFGKTADEINQTPEFLRNYKCNGQIEKGEPTCDTEKYSRALCPNRKHKAGWHPGWREQALYGNIIGLFLADMMVDAVKQLASEGGGIDNIEKLLKELHAQEDADYKHFFESSIEVPTDEDWTKAVDANIVYRSPSICHTARLPAQTRYKGILTQSDSTGEESYYAGIPRGEAEKESEYEPKDMAVMPLVYDESEHAKDCSVPTNTDYKDYFFNRKGHGWRSLTIPNTAERMEYGRDGMELRGLVLICFGGCAWNRCSPGELRQEAMYEGKLKMQMNGQNVLNVTQIGTSECHFLIGSQGHVWKANSHGQYELKTLVDGDEANSFVRISSFIVI